ncbi:MAG: DNA cytosine methyltransferase [Anaerolineae bacterium]|nr:DNA cytosine methyltransferase [Anaerolineae bacterium]
MNSQLLHHPWQRKTVRQAFPEDDWGLSGGGLLLPRSIMPKPRPKAVDFFCGAGGMSLGTIQAGFEVVAAFDNDAEAAVTYTLNLGAYPMQFHFATPEDGERLNRVMERHLSPKKDKKGNVVSIARVAGSGWRASNPGMPGVSHFFFGDVRKWSGEQILEIIGMKRGELDLVMGGPPCQGFSAAGKRDVMDPRNSLIFEFGRLVVELFPRSMVMEEVPEVLSMVTPEGIPVIDALCSILEKGDYGAYDALKKSLTGMMKVKGTVRGRKGEKEEKAVSTPTPSPPQLALF